MIGRTAIVGVAKLSEIQPWTLQTLRPYIDDLQERQDEKKHSEARHAW